MCTDKAWTEKGQNVSHGYFGMVQVTILKNEKKPTKTFNNDCVLLEKKLDFENSQLSVA